MITLISRSSKITSIERIKYEAKKILGIKRGPFAVLESLIKGLHELDICFVLNPPISKITEITQVISGVEALKECIELKKQGKIKKLIAGPNIVVVPTDHDSIIANPAIDIILVPSVWIKDLYKMVIPYLDYKVKVWPAGVEIPPDSSTQNIFDCLVFKKNVPEDLFLCVVAELQKRKVNYKVIEYGKYKREEYFTLLESCYYMIYLQNVESQGIAVHEAWARDIPTLVWNKKEYTYSQGYTIKGLICAPYLSKETGLHFEGILDFHTSLDTFLNLLNTFSPRSYTSNHLSNKASAKIYASIIGITKI